MRKIKVLSIILSVSLIMLFAVPSQAQDSKAMTNAEFADILFRILELDAPEGFDELSDTEAYEVQANILAERGVTLFQNIGANDLVTQGNLCDVLSSSLQRVPDNVTMVPTRGATSNLFNDTLFGYRGQRSIEEMSATVSGLGACPAQDPDQVMEFSKVIEALNTPALSAAVAEAYTPPGENPGGRRGTGPQGGIGYQVPAQNPIPEDLRDASVGFASPVSPQ